MDTGAKLSISRVVFLCAANREVRVLAWGASAIHEAKRTRLMAPILCIDEVKRKGYGRSQEKLWPVATWLSAEC